MDANMVIKKPPPPSFSTSSQEEIVKLIKVKVAMKLVLMALFLGSLLMWIMTPTNTFKEDWMPSIQKKTDSTYFGTGGARLLIYTFPVLFIAAVGCVFLHFETKMNNSSKMQSNGKNHHKFATWKQPALVKGPLGIVSGMELGFFIMFIALLVWSFSTYLHNKFAKITPLSVAKNGEEVWQSKLDTAGVILGLVGNLCLAFLFFPVTRGSSVLPIFGLTLEGSIKYHIWLGHIVMTVFTAHGICYLVYWAVTHNISQMVHWKKTGVSNVAGELALLAGLAMWFTTFPRIHRKFFELFFYTHYLYILFMIFFILHVGFTFCTMMLPSFYLFVIDRFLRFLQSGQNVRLISARVLPAQTLELNFAKSYGLRYNPLSVVFINVPSISKLQWHPFTVTSNNNLEGDKLSVVVKGDGNWTKKLYHILSSPTSLHRLQVSVEGPYGPASTDLFRFDTLVMVSGGSGLTPFISIIRELMFMSNTPAMNCKTPKVILISAFKNSSDLTMLDLILPVSATPPATSDISKLQLQIEAFITREDQEPKTDHNSMPALRAIRFNPHATDAPLSAILGLNGWLWLGMIIASSFVIFLLLTGIITRFYIYPIDQNPNKKFSTSWRAVINMLVLCFSIAMIASLAVFWNKRQNAIEAKQVQNMEQGPMGSSPSSYHDMELESLPRQSLAQAINVHFGRRPDLKRMLLECKGSSIKVLASGPKKLRHEVAAICSSSSAHDLHFESISFTW